MWDGGSEDDSDGSVICLVRWEDGKREEWVEVEYWIV